MGRVRDGEGSGLEEWDENSSFLNGLFLFLVLKKAWEIKDEGCG